MTEPIHRQLRTIRRDQHLTQHQLATLMGVWRSTIGRWERGIQSHSIPDADLHARTLHHHLIATHDNKPLGDLLHLFPRLPALRKAKGLSQQDVADRMWTHRGAVANIEARIRAGDAVRLATVVPYLSGMDWGVGLLPARALERAA